ncbi:hypothetical protein D3C87_1271020 [compost metagenome]
MHDGKAIRPHQGFQARAQRGFQLRRQVDLGHHQQHLAPFTQHLFRCPQVDLGLAAARYAVQQHRLEAGQCPNGVHGGALRVVKFRRLIRLGRRTHRLALAIVQARHRAARRPLALIRGGLAQWRRQGWQHHFAQGPLIVVRRKARHAQPVFVKGGQVIQHLFDRPDLLGLV